jgi:hypothetical protein
MSGKRSPNFSESELHMLLTEVEKHKALLFSKAVNRRHKHPKTLLGYILGHIAI